MSENREPFGDAVARERRAHEDEDVLGEAIALKARFDHVTRYPGILRLNETIDILTLHGLPERHVLDYGCGKGDFALDVLRSGGRVTGFDLSQSYVDECIDRALQAGFTADQFRFTVEDAHALPPDFGQFDIVVGRGVLHHLDISRAFQGLARHVRPGGVAVFLEPLSGSPLLRLFRRLTPTARTVDEHPLKSHDLSWLAHLPGFTARFEFCGRLGAPVAMVSSILRRVVASDFLPARIAQSIDLWLDRRGVLRTWNQYVLIVMRRDGAAVDAT